MIDAAKTTASINARVLALIMSAAMVLGCEQSSPPVLPPTSSPSEMEETVRQVMVAVVVTEGARSQAADWEAILVAAFSESSNVKLVERQAIDQVLSISPPAQRV